MLRHRLRTTRRAPALLVALLLSLIPNSRASAATAYQDCNRVPEGGRCKVTGDPTYGDCREPRCFEKVCEVFAPTPTAARCNDSDGNPCTLGICIPDTGVCGWSEPAPNGLACPDTDGDICTVPKCQNGSCFQLSSSLPDGTLCPDTDGDLCTVARCQTGRCFQGVSLPPVPSMDDPSKVEVSVRLLDTGQPEAFSDCCNWCGLQSLEALRPTPNGPERLEADGRYPVRRSFCGTVVRYGVNDEYEDPRDIMLNMVPSPGFEHFVKGFVNTACTQLSGVEEDYFGVEDGYCPVGACRGAADDPERAGKCIHAELTPADQFFGQDAQFLPINGSGTCGSSWDCSSALEPANDWGGALPPGGIAGQEGREVCVYGMFALDHGGHRPADHHELCCSPDPGHDRPEIHPFDALWFKHPSGEPGWIFGAFQDDSNRYSSPPCGGGFNVSHWSQAPRDVTFKFPFRFPRTQTPIKACLRHTRTTNFAGQPHDVTPVNVTTRWMPFPLTESKTLTSGGVTVLEVVEPAGLEHETQVQLSGCVTNEEVKGFLTLRVAVGCKDGVSCAGLDDPADYGSGLYFAELTFGPDCEP